MEIFEARIYRPELIVLNNSRELSKLYGLIEKDENFIVRWVENKVQHAEVVVATHIAGKVKNGELRLTAEEPLLV